MNADLIAHIKARIAELTPAMEQACRDRDASEAAAKAAAKPYEEARSIWCALYLEIDQLEKMLPPEHRNEQPEKEKPPF